ncbi:MAG TPA: hypothetical protein O0X50_00390 [Methanocorpusculum sp.]|nr:hypothetical protein [Methanocorpusculum sp.]
MMYEHDGVLYVPKDQLADALKYKDLSRMMLDQYIEAGLIVGVDA